MKYYIYLGYDWKIENFIMPTISFFNFLNASAQCTNLDIVASKTDACAPEVIIYYVINAPDGSLFEWEIAGNKFFGGDTIYQSHIDPASFMPKATISMLDGTICHITGKEQITIHGSPVPLFSVQRDKKLFY
jgi:hypothetical protein